MYCFTVPQLERDIKVVAGLGPSVRLDLVQVCLYVCMTFSLYVSLPSNIPFYEYISHIELQPALMTSF